MQQIEQMLAENRRRAREVALAAERLQGVEGTAEESGVRVTVSAVGVLQDLHLAEWVLTAGPEDAAGAIVQAVESARQDAEDQVARLAASMPDSLGVLDPERLGDLLAGRIPEVTR